jgi:hypothetical protein
MLSYHQFIVVTALLCVGSVASDSISLAAQESGQLSSDVTVRIDSIKDSRCPANAMCIWAGRVEVNVLLSKNTDSQSVSLILQPGQQLDTAQVALGTVIYKVVLQNVLPYPGTGFTQAKKATVQVTSV